MAKLTQAERDEIRRLFSRLADIQADQLITKLEADSVEALLDVPGDPWQHYGGGREQ